MRIHPLVSVLLVVVLAHAALYRASEPFYNGDEPRHVMTGVFFRDAIQDLPIRDPAAHVVRYYAQYPALGLAYFPPLFHLIEGVAMTFLGISTLVGKGLVLLAACIACIYLFRMARRTHDRATAALAGLFLGIAPLPFLLSSHVMLEMPALAWSLASIFHFAVYVEGGRRRDLAVAVLAASGACLTRFSAVYLLPLFVLYIFWNRRTDIFRRSEVIVAGACALAITLPYYLLAARLSGTIHWQQVAGGRTTGGQVLRSLVDYPAAIPGQVGWFLLVAALVGFVAAMTSDRRRAASLYVSMMLATYLTFTPMALRDPRFVIYWVPALALFAAQGCTFLWRSPRRTMGILFAASVIAGTAWTTVRASRPFLHGYEAAARYVVANTTAAPLCLFDGTLNGNFIYQMRRLDPERRFWILRGDRTLYNVTVTPEFGYSEPTGGEARMLDLLYRYDPPVIVVEDPPVYFRTPSGDRLRSVLRDDPKRFREVAVFPVESNLPEARGVRIHVYQSLVRNPSAKREIHFEVGPLHRTIKATLPGGVPDHGRN